MLPVRLSARQASRYYARPYTARNEPDAKTISTRTRRKRRGMEPAGKSVFSHFRTFCVFILRFFCVFPSFHLKKAWRPFEMRQAQKNIVERERNTRRGFLPKSFVKIKNRKAVNVYSSFGKGHFLPSVVMEHSVTEVRNAGYDSQEETSRAVTSTS